MRDKKSLSAIPIISTFVVFAIAMIFVTIYVTSYQGSSNKYFKNYNVKVDNELAKVLENQKIMDEKIKNISESGDYTLENPCIIANPYGISPLSAIVIFNTKKEVSVDVFINDKLVTTVEKSNKHIIPVYGLYNNSNNIVTIRTSAGDEFSTPITTSSYDFDTIGLDIEEHIENADTYFLLGNTKDKNSTLRGFDYNNNLLFYLNFGYLSSVKFQNNHFFVNYNPIYSKGSKMENLTLELDYLGKIYYVERAKDNELTSNNNLELEGKSYTGTPHNMYKKNISNYMPLELVDNNKITDKGKLVTRDIEPLLDEADVYKNKFKIATMGNYITYDFGELKNAELVMVNRDAKFTYLYSLDAQSMIKTDIKGETSLYLRINGKYYSLLTTIKI